MPAYVIVEVTINNPEEYKEYMKLTPATIAAFDGRFIVRGGKTESMEGDWHPQRIVVLEFPTVARAKEWYYSDAYTNAKTIRHRTAESRMIIVEGI